MLSKSILLGITILFACFNAKPVYAHDHDEQDEHGHREPEHDEISNDYTELSPQAVKESAIGIAIAGPTQIHDEHRVFGRLLSDGDRTLHVSPRFPGLLIEIRKSLGDSVKAGEVVAVIESDQSLTRYEIVSRLSGVILARHGAPGEHVTEAQEILLIADLSQVWADFQLYGDEIRDIKTGRAIELELGNERHEAIVSFVAPVTDEITQSRLIRAVLPNPEGRLRPGLFVTGVIRSFPQRVAVAVPHEAVQNIRGQQAVFRVAGTTFTATPVTLGRRDSRSVEILSGLVAGDRYVSRNSFIIKADIEKSGAAHEH